MQVSVESAEGLERRMRVSIPSAEYEQAVKVNLQKIGQNARIDGFRPGKAPARVLEQRYGARARQDALTDLLENTYPKALQESGVQPAGQPQIEFDAIEDGKDMSYVAIFDVYPEIEVQGVEGMAIKDAQTEVGDSDVDTLIQRLREQGKTWEDKDGAAELGDQVKIDFAGTIDGEAFEGGSGEDSDLELGSGRFLKEMEDGIVGMKAGESRDVPVTFPEDYHAEDLQGTAASFAVTVKTLQSSLLPEGDADGCTNFG
ncbi:MAG: trigger factor, partial [Oceanococcus sp.]